MCPIDVPYAYVQHYEASKSYVFIQNLSNPEKNTKAEQSEALTKYLAVSFENINQNLYPSLIDELELLSDAEIELLKSQPLTKSAALTLQKNLAAENKNLLSPIELRFSNALDIFLRNHINLMTALEEDRILLTSDEENDILNLIAANKSAPEQRIKGWDNLNKLFA